jgi:hypothetical protein
MRMNRDGFSLDAQGRILCIANRSSFAMQSVAVKTDDPVGMLEGVGSGWADEKLVLT